MSERILFVTGRLAEDSLRRVVGGLADEFCFAFDIAVMKISVAALMHVDWLSRFLRIDGQYDRVIVPGWCQGDLTVLVDRFSISFERGPKDLLDLPAWLGGREKQPVVLDQWSIEILAEINHAPRLAMAQLLTEAQRLAASGADVIDLGCIPGESWSEAGVAVKLLREHGLRVSIDSFERDEVEAAVSAGAELLLSCHQDNLAWAKDLGVELVVIPETPFEVERMVDTVTALAECGVPYQIDPVLEPVGFGFAASLARYFEARRRWPQARMMMGIGNLTELSEVDSAGMNFLLAAICEELRIGSVLTTQVINWSRSSVREFDLARRMTHHSVQSRVLPKHVDSRLVMLRDPRIAEQGPETLQALADQIRDPNYRIFAESGMLHVMNRDGYWTGHDPYELFRGMMAAAASEIRPGHAFYLGYEMCKALTALKLGKQFTQDEELRWGFLTMDDDGGRFTLSGSHGAD